MAAAAAGESKSIAAIPLPLHLLRLVCTLLGVHSLYGAGLLREAAARRKKMSAAHLPERAKLPTCAARWRGAGAHDHGGKYDLQYD